MYGTISHTTLQDFHTTVQNSLLPTTSKSIIYPYRCLEKSSVVLCLSTSCRENPALLLLRCRSKYLAMHYTVTIYCFLFTVKSFTFFMDYLATAKLFWLIFATMGTCPTVSVLTAVVLTTATA